ncbi:MAG: DNA translocase FtsK [Elusimicrobiota bacterium]|nr:DNA translocase FtsK [Elusimicrobiota bacterium]
MSKNKGSKRNDRNKNRDILALFFALAAFVSAYSILLPSNSGILGKAFSNIVNLIFGDACYILPILLFWYFLLNIIRSFKQKGKIDFLWSMLSIISASSFLSADKDLLGLQLSGGWVGVSLYPFIERLLGHFLSLGVLAIIFIYSLLKLFRIPIGNLLKSFIACREEKDKEQIEPAVIFDKKEQKSSPKISQSAGSLFGEEEYDDEVSGEPNIIASKNKKKNKNTVYEKIDSSGIDYVLPQTYSLAEDEIIDYDENKKELLSRAELLKKTLAEFDIKADVKDIIAGPVVTRYDLTLAPGMKVQSIDGVIENISLAMRAAAIRVVPIPEKGAVGIEVPNPESIIVGLRGVLESEAFIKSQSKLTLALGETTDGKGYVAKLDSMPHLLIAGSTGSGKSVGIHSIILSILFKARPDEVKFMLIDPKRVEMPVYSDIPHLYNPCVRACDADIITDPQQSAAALKKLVAVMEDRYNKYAQNSVRNINEYNAKMQETGGQKEFSVVVIIDELADLMLVAQKEIEDSIQRLAQMARAVGIHLILATQRPSVNVITGVIKANFPARLSFQTSSKIDSRVILDMMGAENLLGKGDMLFLPPDESRPTRLQGAYVSLREIESIVNFINKQNFPRVYDPPVDEIKKENGFKADKNKELLPIIMLIKERKRISQDLLKANFGGSAKATNILSILETENFIAKPEGTNKWQINWNKVNEYLSESEIKIKSKEQERGGMEYE